MKNAGKKNSRRYRSRSLSASSTDSYSSGKKKDLIKSLDTHYRKNTFPIETMYRDFIPLRQILKLEILPPQSPPKFICRQNVSPPFKTILTSISFILFSPLFLVESIRLNSDKKEEKQSSPVHPDILFV